MIIYVWIVCLLFMGFLLLFGRMRWLEKLWELLHRTREGMDRASQLRAVENRHRLMEFQQKNNVWYRIEEVLRYSGLRRRMPHFTAEKWVAGNVLLIAAVFGGTQVLGCKMITSLLYLMITMAVEMILLNTFRFLEYRSVNDNILKCLNFLGNYSLTAGEITGVLGQVSKYMEEPLKGVMEECAYEAQMTGNSSTALLAMAEKVEHPKFKELARNLEISIRYMADLTTLNTRGAISSRGRRQGASIFCRIFSYPFRKRPRRGACFACTEFVCFIISKLLCLRFFSPQA